MSINSCQNEAQHYSSVLGLNIQSLRFHHPELVLLLETLSNKPEAIILTETWLTENDPLTKLNIDGYQPIESKPRKCMKRRSGGVAFYFKKGIQYFPIDFQTHIECSVYRVLLDNSNSKIFCVIYRPPSLKLHQFFSELEKLLHFLKSLNEESMIFGDFNIDMLKNEKDKNDYVNLLLAYGFKVQNLLPTRVTPTSKTCIDHIITTKDQKTETLETTISDHFAVTAEITLKVDKNKQIAPVNKKIRNLNNIKGEKALNFLFYLDQQFRKIPENLNADLYMDALSKTIVKCVDKYAPEKCLPLSDNTHSSSWITNKIKNAIGKRDRLFKQWIENPTEENRLVYKKSRNNVTRLIRQEQREDNFRKLGKNPTPKQIYKTLKTKKSENEDLKQLPELEKLNDFFASVGPSLANNIKSSHCVWKIEKVLSSMVLHPTNEHEISKILRQMKNKKSTGYDGISNEILKCCSPVVEHYLAKVINKCFNEEIIPDCLKKTKVLPLHKKGDKSNPGNYRPISLLSPLSKVIEKVLLRRMMKFCVKHKILSSTQFGFRPKMSCVHAIATVTEYIRNEIDKKSTGQACFIDLSKAFDTIDHKILLKKLEAYGFRGKVLKLLENYLQNRLQYININGMSSSEKSIKCGIPQGSVLGPFLFLLYVNDLSTTCSESKVTMFADDTTVINAGKRIDTLVREDIKTMTKWFDSNKLTINAEKCEAIHFGRGRPEAIVIKDKTLDYKSSCKYLGLQIDPRLSFKDHIDKVVKKLNKFCGLIYHVRHLYPRKCLLMFYNSFAKSVITYGLLIYGSAAKTNLAKIDSAQRRIFRAIFFKKNTIQCRKFCRKTKLIQYMSYLSRKLCMKFSENSEKIRHCNC